VMVLYTYPLTCSTCKKYNKFRSGRRGSHNLLLIIMSPTINCLQCKLLHCLSEEWHRQSCNWLGVWNLYQNLCKIPVWIYGLGKKLGPVVLVALIAYHTPPLMSCSDIWWNNMAFSTDQYLLFWASIFAERGNQISSWNRMNVGWFLRHVPYEVPGHKV
jgi:EamA domain-containing membrane protein RarD